MNRKKNIFTIFLVAFCTLAFTVYEFRMSDIVRKFDYYISKNQTQKIFIHTNKDNFEINENIWFSVYVTNADFQPDSTNENIYTELISPESEIIYSRLLKLENGMAYADFPLPDSLQSGNYQIRAFTNLMKNYNSDFFFTKEIMINNPKNQKISKNLYLKSKKVNRKIDNFSISFFPEGGEMVYGIESKIAFKATNYLGNGIEIYGYIKNKQNKVIAELKTEHNGIGTFLFTPDENQKYTYEVYYKNKKKTNSFAKEVLKYGYIINIDQNNLDSIKVNVNANLFENNDTYYKTIYIIAQQQDEIKFRTVKILKNLKSEFYIPIDSFNTGIVQLTLFNGKAEPRCERLFFVNRNNFPTVEVDIENFSTTEKIKFKISNSEKKSEISYFSVSVLDTSENITSDNILASMLLTSDLGGNIENPNYYFQDWNNLKSKQLDLVMLTNGWRRFDWTKIMSDKLDSLDFESEKGITVSGKITKPFFELPAKYSTVTMTVLDSYNDVYKTKTDENGNYFFKNLYYNDTLNMLVEAISTKGKKNIIVNIDGYDTVSVDYSSFSQNFFKIYNRKNIIEEEKTVKTETNSGLHGSPDQVIYADKNSTRYSNVFEMIKSKAPGVDVRDDGAKIRGSGTTNNEPLYLINDIPVDANAVKSLSVNDVERVEIIKSMAKSAIYGIRAKGGVIAIYTKEGYNINRGWATLKLIAYYTPKEYYQPNFETENDSVKFSSIYWKPNVITDINGNAEINFKNPLQKSTFKIVLQGITESGKLIYYEKNLD